MEGALGQVCVTCDNDPKKTPETTAVVDRTRERQNTPHGRQPEIEDDRLYDVRKETRSEIGGWRVSGSCTISHFVGVWSSVKRVLEPGSANTYGGTLCWHADHEKRAVRHA